MTLEVTEGARKAIKEAMSDKSLEGPIRVFMASGCGGAQLALSMGEASENDEQFEFDGQTYLVDRSLGSQVGDLKVDYVDDGTRKGFVVQPEKPLPEMGGCSGCSGAC